MAPNPGTRPPAQTGHAPGTDEPSPQPAHRWALAALVGVHEFDLWPELGGTPPINPEIVATYPHRSSVPREIWHALFAGASERIDVLVYSGLFLAEDVGLMQVLAGKAAAGVSVRVLLGDPDSPAVGQRGQDEGIDDAMSAKIRNALVPHRARLVPHGAELRLHRTVLCNSVYRADDDMLVNQHVFGLADAQALHVRRRDGGAVRRPRRRRRTRLGGHRPAVVRDGTLSSPRRDRWCGFRGGWAAGRWSQRQGPR